MPFLSIMIIYYTIVYDAIVCSMIIENGECLEVFNLNNIKFNVTAWCFDIDGIINFFPD